jgi:hypothetical protein
VPDVRKTIQIDDEADAIIRAEQEAFAEREYTALAYGRAVQRLVKRAARVSPGRGSRIAPNTSSDNETEAA